MPYAPRSLCAPTLAWILMLLFPAFHAGAEGPGAIDSSAPTQMRWNRASKKTTKANPGGTRKSASLPKKVQRTSFQNDAEILPTPDDDVSPPPEVSFDSESVLDDSYSITHEAAASMDYVGTTAAACCGNDRYWARAEYLYWQTRGMNVPPLVTTSSSGTAEEDAGVLGLPTTSVLIGNKRFVDDGISGGRIHIGGWWDNCRDVGLDFIYTAFGDQSDSFSASSSQFPILARPFFNVESQQQDARLLGFPDSVSGNVTVGSTTEYQVFELLIRRAISHGWAAPTSIFYGYRAAELKDSLVIRDFGASLAGATAGASVAITDEFRSRNRFHGFEMGLSTDFQLSACWQVSLVGKVAFGETDSVTTINGQTVATNATGDVTTAGSGLLTQASNIGRFESNSHGVLQDFSIRFSRYLDCGVTANLGYGIHRWLDVARSGEQVDLSVNPTQIPPGTLVGEARPQFNDNKSDFVAQGITVGLEYAW